MTARLLVQFLATAVLGLISLVARAEDLGTKADTYKGDPDARDQMRTILKRKQASGELDRFWQDYRGKAIDAVKHPLPLGIPTRYATRVEHRAVRFVLSSDFRDQRGQVIARQGQAIEPLKLNPLSAGLIFVDGRDPAQVRYAVQRLSTTPLKIVLIAGSAFDLRVKYQGQGNAGAPNVPFYFDQRRMIVDSLARLYGIRIDSVPAELTQEGTGLRVAFGLPGGRG